MTTETTTTTKTSSFTSVERSALQALRARYRQDHDLFSTRELAQLRFFRWLHETGRLPS